jgi:hypothetical protein
VTHVDLARLGVEIEQHNSTALAELDLNGEKMEKKSITCSGELGEGEIKYSLHIDRRKHVLKHDGHDLLVILLAAKVVQHNLNRIKITSQIRFSLF